MDQNKIKQIISPLVKQFLPVKEVPAARKTKDIAEHWDLLMPPQDIRLRVGPFQEAADYRNVAEGAFQLLREVCELNINDDVLDIGCGCGQMAVPMIKYLNHKATYEGLDIDSVSIDWCDEHIAPRHSNFHFHTADIFSTHYNTAGKGKAVDYKFPYKDASFDVVFAKSVLTHLLPAEIENYISETARVLRPGGRCWLTFFLLNKESTELIDAGKSTLPMTVIRDRHRIINPEIPEAAVAIEETMVEKFFEKNKLKMKKPFMYGSWCGRSEGLGYQDGIVATKE